MTQKNALIVDDEPDIRELLEITLGRMDIQTRSAEDVKSAHSLLAEHTFDFCLTDMKLPDGNGIELVQHISANYPNLPVAMITAHGNMESAVEALKAGAFDFVSKPVNLELLRNLVDTALNLEPLDVSKTNNAALSLLGETEVMQFLRRQINKLARSQAPIYISGESGSGKELVAKMIHEQGPRAQGPFIPVNCGAIPSELMESEFFGHVKGSFTGAVSDKEGLFQAAHGGTLFLDEVADFPNQQIDRWLLDPDDAAQAFDKIGGDWITDLEWSRYVPANVPNTHPEQREATSTATPGHLPSTEPTA